MSIFLPFNNNPFQINGDDTSYTVPAGKYAIIYPKMDSTSNLIVGGDIYYPANLISQDFSSTNSGFTFEGSISIPLYGRWDCVVYAVNHTVPGSYSGMRVSLVGKYLPSGVPTDYEIESVPLRGPAPAKASEQFELNYGQRAKFTMLATGNPGETSTYRFRATRIDVQPTHSFWVPAGTTITGKFNYAEYVTP